MNISVIEIGTNSTKMITVEVFSHGRYRVMEKVSTVNRLSSKMYEKNIINEEAMEAGLKIIGGYIEEAKCKNSELVSIFSTSVLRDASNRQDFIERVKSSYGYNIDVIGGEVEAFLAYKACSSHISDMEQPFAVIDIGGGSTEMVMGTKSGIEKKISMDVGAVRLTEMFIKNDPISERETEAVTEYVMWQISEHMNFELKGIKLLGTGGTIKTLATIQKKLDFKNESDINGVTVAEAEISGILTELLTKNLADRKRLVGLNPKRADVIIGGLILLLTVMSIKNIHEITVSSQGVLEGFVEEYLGSQEFQVPGCQSEKLLLRKV